MNLFTSAFRIVFFLTLLAGCSHPLEIVGGGDILSESTTRDCSWEAQPCANVIVGSYEDSYRAVAREGWQFSHWDNYCEQMGNDSTTPCTFEANSATVRKHWSKTMPPLVANFIPSANNQLSYLPIGTNVRMLKPGSLQYFLTLATDAGIVLVRAPLNESKDGLIIVDSLPTKAIADMASVFHGQFLVAYKDGGIELFVYDESGMKLLASSDHIASAVTSLSPGTMLALIKEADGAQELVTLVADGNGKLVTNNRIGNLGSSAQLFGRYLLTDNGSGAGSLRLLEANENNQLTFSNYHLDYNDTSDLLPRFIVPYYAGNGIAQLLTFGNSFEQEGVYQTKVQLLELGDETSGEVRVISEFTLETPEVIDINHVAVNGEDIFSQDSIANKKIMRVYILTGGSLLAYRLPDFTRDPDPLPLAGEGLLMIGQKYFTYDTALHSGLLPTTPVGRVFLEGDVVGANVSIHRYPDVSGAPLCTFISGVAIEVPEICVSEPGLYLVTAAGGFNTRFNGERLPADAYLPVDNTLHALMTHMDFKRDWRVSLHTELVYTMLQPSISALLPNVNLNDFIDRYTALKTMLRFNSWHQEYVPRVRTAPSNTPLDQLPEYSNLQGTLLSKAFPELAQAFRDGKDIYNEAASLGIVPAQLSGVELPRPEVLLGESGGGLQIGDSNLSVIVDGATRFYAINSDDSLTFKGEIDTRHTNLTGDWVLAASSTSTDQTSQLPGAARVFSLEGSGPPRLIAEMNDSFAGGMRLSADRLYVLRRSSDGPYGLELITRDIDAFGASTTELGSISLPDCRCDVSDFQVYRNKIYVIQIRVGNDGNDSSESITTVFGIDADGLPHRIESLTNYSVIPDYFVFDGDIAWLKPWSLRLNQNDDTFLSYYQAVSDLRLFDLSSDFGLQEIVGSTLPDQSIITQDLAVVNQHLVSLDAHVLRAYEYSKDSPAEDWSLSYLNPLPETFFEMKLHGTTAYLLGNGHISSLRLPLTAPE